MFTYIYIYNYTYIIHIDNLLFKPSDWLRAYVLKMSHAD